MDPKQRYLLNQFKEALSRYSPQQLIFSSLDLQVPDSIIASIVAAKSSRYELGLDYKDVIGLSFLFRYYSMTNRKIWKYYASSIIDKYSRGRHCKLYNISNEEINEAMMTIDIDEIRKYTNYLIK